MEIPRYTYRVFWSTEDQEYVAECNDVPGLSGLAETPEAAVRELQVALRGWLSHLSENGQPWPEPQPVASAN